MSRAGYSAFIVAMIVALFVLGVVMLAIGTKFDPRFRTFFESIPGFGQSNETLAGISIIGLDIDGKGGTPVLEYYTGSDWEPAIGNKEGFISLSGKKFKTAEVQNEFKEFYFSTPRFGGPEFTLGSYNVKMEMPKSLMNKEEPRVLVRSQAEPRQTTFYTSEDTIIKEKYTPQGYYSLFSIGSSAGSEEDFYVFSADNSLHTIITAPIDRRSVRYFLIKSERILPNNEFYLHPNKIQALELHLKWRDQILAGQACEKYLTLNFEDRGVPTKRAYAVKRIDDKLFVDLNVWIKEEDISKEKYNEGCFDASAIIGLEEINSAFVVISFDPKDKVSAVYWQRSVDGSGGWYIYAPEITTRGGYTFPISASDMRANRLLLSSAEQSDFYLGLSAIVSKLDVRGWNDYSNVRVHVFSKGNLLRPKDDLSDFPLNSLTNSLSEEQQNLIYSERRVDNSDEKIEMVSKVIESYNKAFRKPSLYRLHEEEVYFEFEKIGISIKGNKVLADFQQVGTVGDGGLITINESQVGSLSSSFDLVLLTHIRALNGKNKNSMATGGA